MAVTDASQQPRKQDTRCDLRVVDSVFLGFVCTRPTLAA